MTIAYVVKTQVPMLMTFDEDEAEFIITNLAHAIDKSHKIIDFFTFKDEDDSEVWE